MSISSIMSNVRIPAAIGKLGLKLQKHAPTIMMVGGAALIIGGTINACRQTPKALNIIEDCNARLEELLEAQENADSEEYTPKDARKDRMTVYKDLFWGMTKTYGVSVLAITAGLGLMAGSHNIMLRRNAALTAGYSALLAQMQQYRDRVRNEIGYDNEVRLYSGAENRDIVVESTNDDGETVEVTEKAMVFDDGSAHSPYSRLFSVENLQTACQGNWSRNPEENLKFLRTQQCWANDVLRSRGYLFLNEVYHALGFKDSSDGCIVGWVYDPSRENSKHNDPSDDGMPIINGIDSKGLVGDNLVDFGIYRGLKENPSKVDFLNGVEPCIWLDFNVDGVIYDLI